MKNTIGIRREDLSKKGEKRVAIVPQTAARLIQAGHHLLVQPRQHPETHEVKRAFADEEYQKAGAQLAEDLGAADLIFGLKEVEIAQLLADKTYLIFSHTHKGQVKNRKLLQALVKGRNTLIDYELITQTTGARVLTAFTFFAGYAGMTDSLWTFGQRMQHKGIDHPFSLIPQSIAEEALSKIKSLIQAAGAEISRNGTPAALPPLITVFLGTGKTSYGAQVMYDLLPVQEITLAELADTYANGSRKQVYKLVLDVPEMFRLKADAPQHDSGLSDPELFQLYLRSPQLFESNLEQVMPYVSMLMNCIIWSPAFPRLLSRNDTAKWYGAHPTLEVIGDITCDPEGAIEFSQETWITEPVFIYEPAQRKTTLGMTGEGIAVMAVTNLPCEFAADASRQFCADFGELLQGIAAADFAANSPEQSGLPPEIQRAVILWQGRLMPAYQYMEAYLP